MYAMPESHKSLSKCNISYSGLMWPVHKLYRLVCIAGPYLPLMTSLDLPRVKRAVTVEPFFC